VRLHRAFRLQQDRQRKAGIDSAVFLNQKSLDESPFIE
jgi:hypothetical protein